MRFYKVKCLLCKQKSSFFKYVRVCACACVCRCLQKSEEVIKAHEAAVTGGRKSLDMDAGHPTSVL